VENNYKRNNFLFGRNFKFPSKFELKIQEFDYIRHWLEI
jgi:hypothetical protein